jgi:hypothetical protein
MRTTRKIQNTLVELTQTESTQFIGQHAVVIGASMAGLLAARVTDAIGL